MSLVRLLRLSDAPPPARELVDVTEDGAMTGWRSIHDAVGRFGGSVPDLGSLRALVEATAGVEPPSVGTFPFDATTDNLRTEAGELVISDKSAPDGPWGQLLVACRGLLDEVSGSPVAAIALVVDGPGRLRLEHRGSEVLGIRLESLRFEVTRWRDRDPVGSREVSGLGLGRVEAGPGWSQDLSIEDGPAGEPGDLLTASASFVAEDAGIYVPVLVLGRAKATLPDS